MSARVLVVLIGLIAGCGPRALELSLTLDPACNVQVPAGGSISYELVSGGEDAGTPPTLCGGCIAVTTAITDAAGLLARLREAAPACTIAREVPLRARVTAHTMGACSSGGAVPPLCASSEPMLVGDGRSDGQLALTMQCSAACVPNDCVSITCEAQGKNCDQVLDGCGKLIDCGSCKPPEKCGRTGIPNVCGK